MYILRFIPTSTADSAVHASVIPVYCTALCRGLPQIEVGGRMLKQNPLYRLGLNRDKGIEAWFPDLMHLRLSINT